MKTKKIIALILCAFLVTGVTLYAVNEYNHSHSGLVRKSYDELCKQFGQLYNHTYNEDGSLHSACVWKYDWWYKYILRQETDEHEYIVRRVYFDSDQMYIYDHIQRESIKN